MDKKYSKHQQKLIKNYSENREAISLQRLSELVTELYLAEGKARERQWKSARFCANFPMARGPGTR